MAMRICVLRMTWSISKRQSLSPSSFVRIGDDKASVADLCQLPRDGHTNQADHVSSSKQMSFIRMCTHFSSLWAMKEVQLNSNSSAISPFNYLLRLFLI